MPRRDLEEAGMSLVFTMPGRLGDACLQWPVAYHWCAQQEVRCEIWMDEKTCVPLVPLFEAQPCVERVVLRGGVEHYQCGGQPYTMNINTAEHLDHEIVHLGLRGFPSRQITLE